MYVSQVVVTSPIYRWEKPLNGDFPRFLLSGIVASQVSRLILDAATMALLDLAKACTVMSLDVSN